MNEVAPSIVNFIIVPKLGTLTFGSLMEIKSENDEIFVSDATVQDVEIIDSITASRIQSSGNVVSATNTINAGIQSQALSSTTTTSTSTGTTTTTSSTSTSSSTGSSGSSGSGGSGYSSGSGGSGSGGSGSGGGSSGGGGYGY